MRDYDDDGWISGGLKWQAGLWRGILLDPAHGGFDGEKHWSIHDVRLEIAKGAEPIQDAKGFGVRLVSVFSERGWVRPHFRQWDSDFNRVFRAALPVYHDACVRVLHEHLSRVGYESLYRLCASVVPVSEPFDFREVVREKTVDFDGGFYRPDITIRPAVEALGDIEIELVNKHKPTGPRLEAAEKRGSLVLCMDIRDVVMDLMLDNRRSVLPDDDHLLKKLLGLRLKVVQPFGPGYFRFYSWYESESRKATSRRMAEYARGRAEREAERAEREAERAKREAERAKRRAAREAAAALAAKIESERRAAAAAIAEAARLKEAEEAEARAALLRSETASYVREVMESARALQNAGNADEAVSALEKLLGRRTLRTGSETAVALRGYVLEELHRIRSEASEGLCT